MPMSDKFREKRFTALSAVARKHGGELLTKSYSVLHAPMTVRCKQGHRFAITPKNALRGLWCVKCRPLGRQSEFLAAAQKLARAKGGKCLSDAYETARINLRWQCKDKHHWSASFDNVMNKQSWCPECAVAAASDRKTEWWRKRSSRRSHSTSRR